MTAARSARSTGRNTTRSSCTFPSPVYRACWAVRPGVDAGFRASRRERRAYDRCAERPVNRAEHHALIMPIPQPGLPGLLGLFGPALTPGSERPGVNAGPMTAARTPGQPGGTPRAHHAHSPARFTGLAGLFGPALTPGQAGPTRRERRAYDRCASARSTGRNTTRSSCTFPSPVHRASALFGPALTPGQAGPTRRERRAYDRCAERPVNRAEHHAFIMPIPQPGLPGLLGSSARR